MNKDPLQHIFILMQGRGLSGCDLSGTQKGKKQVALCSSWLRNGQFGIFLGMQTVSGCQGLR